MIGTSAAATSPSRRAAALGSCYTPTPNRLVLETIGSRTSQHERLVPFWTLRAAGPGNRRAIAATCGRDLRPSALRRERWLGSDSPRSTVATLRSRSPRLRACRRRGMHDLQLSSGTSVSLTTPSTRWPYSTRSTQLLLLACAELMRSASAGRSLPCSGAVRRSRVARQGRAKRVAKRRP
jgi:hypothetical protein